MGSDDAYLDIDDEAQASCRMKRGGFGVVSALGVILFVLQTSLHSLGSSSPPTSDAPMVSIDKKVTPGQRKKDASTSLGGATGPFSSDEWRIEKVTNNLKSGAAMATQEWISTYLCTPKTTCPSDLGCGNMRVWCVIGSPYTALEFMNNTFELHWVSAPTLQDLTVGDSKTRATDAWIGYLEELNGDDMRFSAFSHVAARKHNF